VSIAILTSRAQIGTDAPAVTIEVFLSGGLPGFSIVGLPETAVRESKDRVRAAILSSGFKFPLERITVSLGPADMRKTGGRFDLAIALGILAASKQLPADSLAAYEFFGELALNGDIRRVPGVLPAALKARAAGNALIVPTDNGAEALLANVTVLAAVSLLQVTAHLKRVETIPALPPEKPAKGSTLSPDLCDVKGQAHAKRALEVAAAGGHNLLFIGPPGTGKSMLAARLPGILPPMSENEAIETAAIDSVLGRAPDLSRWRCRPFRSPHHTASAPALVGGGPEPSPGEVSRAHNGVLFLDELPEFNRNVLEVLREPLEAGTITISRAGRQADFPARFQLIAAMNPCPCGYLGDPGGDCGCSAEKVAAYRGKISGPLLDRIDLHVEVGRPPKELLRGGGAPGEKSAEVARRVINARQHQIKRAGTSNARLRGEQLERECALDSESWQLLDNAAERFALSVRSYQRILRVARTIADLSSAQSIRPAHIAEAMSLRGLRRGKP
jgi:magnesium chelatase family protein